MSGQYKSFFWQYRYLLLLEASSYITLLLQKTHISTSVFTNQKMFFTKKGEKQKQRCLFCSESYGGSEGPQQREWPSQAPSREPHSAHRPQAAIALNGTYENLCYSSICFGHPLVRCVPKVSGKPREVIFEVWECSNIFPYKLMVLLLHFAPFWPTKCFIGKLHLCTA